MYRQWDGNPLGLGLVAEDKPSEFSCTMPSKSTKITAIMKLGADIDITRAL